MSQLTYDRSDHTLTLIDKDGNQVGQWTAYNNNQSGTDPFPIGTHNFSWRNPHASENTPNSAYGSSGIFIFNVPGREGLGVHSGRATTADQAGRTGPQHATNGCIRTTDEATAQIVQTHSTDPVTQIRVQE